MAKIKSPTPKLRPAHWAILMVAILVIPTAIYAMTTWNDSPGYQATPKHISHGSQLPDQSRMVEGLQGRPANSQDFGGSSSAQLQPSAATPAMPAQSPPQEPPPQPPIDYPPNPDPCKPPRATEIACIQY